jgi:hypothetical protein
LKYRSDISARVLLPIADLSKATLYRRHAMPRGDKSSYTDKQKRQAHHIEEGYEKRGVPEEEAERRAWATENKISGGGKKSGSGKDSKKS